MNAKERKPAFEGKSGNVKVSVYKRQQTRKGKTYTTFLVADCSTGKRKLIGFADAKAAKNKADEIASGIATGCLESAYWDDSFKREIQQALEIGRALNVGLLPAMQTLSSAVKLVGGMDKVLLAAQMSTLSNLMLKIGDCESGFSNRLSLRSDLLLRSATVRSKVAAYDHELKKIENGMASIRSARTMKDFSNGISLTSSSEFSASPAASAASLVQSLNVTEETTIRRLLGATNASTWAYIGKPKGAHFVPEVVMPVERQILQHLNDDPAVSASHVLYRLWLDQEGTKSVDWMTVGGFDTSEGWKQIKGWSPSKTATSVVFEDRQYGYFDGKCKLSPTQPVYRIDQLGVPEETASFNSVGLEKVWEGGDAYAKPLLEVLDSIKDSREGSPLFRAYLFLQLTDLMRLQPDAWGLAFAPAVQAHAVQVRRVVGDRFISGDWFVPSKVSDCSGRLEELFASLKSVSYAKQADGLLAIARTISNGGLRFVGFVGLDGKSNYFDTSSSGEVWGYSAASRQPVLLAARIETNKPLNFQAVALSPLFAFERPCRDYLTQAGVNPGDPSFEGVLPPLFQKPAQR